jgi:hypothetical protein
MKYKILRDYGSEGNIFDDSEFDTIEEAVKHAVAQNFSSIFRIVTIHWEPELKK